MTLPPEPILDSALLALHRALVHARNITLHPDANTSNQVNDLMEALHEIPDFLGHWDKHNLDELRLHLRCFDHSRWEGSPNLVEIFEKRLAIFSAPFPKDNADSWKDIREFVEEFPNDDYWSAWKPMVREILSALEALGLVPLFRIGQSMHQIIFSTLDYRLTKEPRVTLQFQPKEQTVRISYSCSNVEFHEPLSQETIPFSIAAPKIILGYLRRLWTETKPGSPIPDVLS